MLNLVTMKEDHLPMVLGWRNHPEVRKHVYTQHEISMAEHLSWFGRVSHDPTMRLFVCYEEDTPVGVVTFSEIDLVNRRACWGFYSGILDRRGIGSRMELTAINYAFGELGLDKLWGEVLSTNTKVLALHKKFGFLVEGMYRNHYVLNGVAIDVVRIALSRNAWERYLREPMEEIVYRRRLAEPISAGKIYEERIVLSREMIAKFMELSGDNNPIHSDQTAARAAGFPSPIVQGMLLGAILAGLYGARFPGPGSVHVSQDLRFIAPMLEGDELLIHLNVMSRIGRMLILNIEIRRLGDESNKLLVTGEAELLAPRPATLPA